MNIYYKYKFYTMRHLQGILVTVCKFRSHVLDSKIAETVEDVIAIWVDWFSISTSPIDTPHLITCRGIIPVWHSDTPPPHFPVHIRGIYKWNTFWCVVKGWLNRLNFIGKTNRLKEMLIFTILANFVT